MSLLQMSLQGGVLVLITAALRAAAKERLPRNTFLTLWAVALARLLLPISAPSRYSAYTAVKHSSILRERLAPVARVSAGGATLQRTVSPWTVVWALGVIAFALYFATGYAHFWKKFRFSIPVQNEFAVRWMKAHSIRRRVGLRQSDQISAPLTYGILRPVILLPKCIDWEDVGQLQYILTHEMTHIRHWDVLWKLFSTVALCLHWFNPLVWALCALLARDLELRCDECVVRRFGETSRPDYARTLIRMEERKSGLEPLSSHFSRTAIEERIMSVMRSKRRSVAAIALAAVLVVGISVTFATSANNTIMRPEDVKMLKQFQFPGWEQMSVAEFRERAETLLDTEPMHEWYSSMEGNFDYLQASAGNDPMCRFLYRVLNDLLEEGSPQKQREYSGAVVSDFTDVQSNAVLEYDFRKEVLDSSRLTVGEYCAAAERVSNAMQTILQGLSREMLADQAAMNAWLPEKMAEIYEQCGSEFLRIVPLDYSYRPLSEFQLNPPNIVEGKRSDAALSEYTEANSEEEGRVYPSATQEDYASLLELKTADYQSMTLETFNARLLEWSDEDYERMERVGESTAMGDVEKNDRLSAAEKQFLTLTANLSGQENGALLISRRTNRPMEDPCFTGGDYTKETEEGGREAWCALYYQLSYHVADRTKVTVGERDRCIGGFLQDVDRFWTTASLEELLRVDEENMVSRLKSFAAQNSSPNVVISVDEERVLYETMDERLIR